MSNKSDEKPVVKAVEEPPAEETVEEGVDPGAFPGQNPGRLIVLPEDTGGTLDYQGYVEGRLPVKEEE